MQTLLTQRGGLCTHSEQAEQHSTLGEENEQGQGRNSKACGEHDGALHPPLEAMYPKNKKLMASFAARFLYTDTIDQRQAIFDVEQDVTEKNPMDRFSCGDVGFGKIEVALGALFLAVATGRQTMVLM